MFHDPLSIIFMTDSALDTVKRRCSAGRRFTSKGVANFHERDKISQIVYIEGGFGKIVCPRRQKESFCGRAIGADSKGRGSSQLRAVVSLIRA
jgi:hypothetical protein